MRVLVAESDANTTQSICEILESDERVDSVVKVSDGAAAVAGARDVDVVVIDLSIKGLGSLGAIHSIRNRAHALTVVAVGTPDDGWKDQAAILEGADDVLEWPGDASILADRISQLSRDKRQTDQPI